MKLKSKQYNFPNGKYKLFIIEIVLLLLLVFVIILSLMTGRIDISVADVVKILLSKFGFYQQSTLSMFESIIIDVRLPRVISGVLVGAGLSLAGAAFQGLFRNPLVSPHILGVSSGAGFGAAIAILLFNNIFITQVLSFLFGIIAVVLAYLLSRMYKSTPILMLVLAGIIIGSPFSALTSFIKYIADPMNKMPTIVFWLMGSLNNISNKEVLVVTPMIIVCSAVLLLIRWKINILAMGEEDAKALGLNTRYITILIILCSTIITAAAVCISGVIGWIGLVVPHIARLLVGPDHKRVLPVSMLLGGSYLVIVDMIARSVMAIEIPIGILTAIIGAPVFAYLLRRRPTGWQ